MIKHPIQVNTKIRYRVPHGCGCSGKWQVKDNTIKEIKHSNNVHFYILYSGETIPQTQVDHIIV